ncbi:MAG: hypothetical protein HY549_10475 [Elusimicrobia bacterium]|nr:hypothetical protein [Elusimicrobiota bacterium]
MLLIAARKPQSIPPQKAEADVEQIFHEIRQILRVSGIDPLFQRWASYPRFFSALWEAMTPNAQTRAFEEAADRLRAEAVAAASGMDRLSALAKAGLGESQAYQVQRVLMLYHYANPKLLLFVSTVAQALQGQEPRRAEGASAAELIERGVPPRMFPMEMIEERPSEDVPRKIFRDIKRSLGLSSIPCDYRSLGLWPGYLAAGWERLKPAIKSQAYRKAVGDLAELSSGLARELPYPVVMPIDDLGEREDMGAVVELTEYFETVLPALVLNIALFSLDWQAAEILKRSPFPARPRHRPNGH